MKNTPNIKKLSKYDIRIDTKKVHKIVGDIYVIDVPMYRCSVYMMFDKQARELEEKWENSCNYDGQTRDYLRSGNEVLITFPTKNPKLSTVAHEIVHACQMILKNAGHNFYEGEPDEPFAYLHTYLFENYLKIKKIKL